MDVFVPHLFGGTASPPTDDYQQYYCYDLSARFHSGHLSFKIRGIYAMQEVYHNFVLWSTKGKNRLTNLSSVW